MSGGQVQVGGAELLLDAGLRFGELPDLAAELVLRPVGVADEVEVGVVLGFQRGPPFGELAADLGLAAPVAAKLVSRVRAGQPALTRREVEILACVARGLSNPEIGQELFISEATVKSHLMRIFENLSVRTVLPRSPPRSAVASSGHQLNSGDAATLLDRGYAELLGAAMAGCWRAPAVVWSAGVEV